MNKKFLEPLLLRWLPAKRKYGYFGDYQNWSEATKNSVGYAADKILEKVKESTLKVKNNDKIYEKDTIIYNNSWNYPYNYQVLSSLLLISQLNNNKINIIDFGGSLGTTYFQHRRMLSHLSELRWNIVEQEKFVETGKKFFEDGHLSFHYALEACIKSKKPDCILLAGVLQYLEKPYDIIDTILKYNINFIIVNRTPFFKNMPDKITIQKVPPGYYEASLPYRIFNYEKFKNKFFQQYNIIADSFSIKGKIKIGKIPAYKRFILFRRKDYITEATNK